MSKLVDYIFAKHYADSVIYKVNYINNHKQYIAINKLMTLSINCIAQFINFFQIDKLAYNKIGKIH